MRLGSRMMCMFPFSGRY